MDSNRLSHRIFKAANKGKATGFLWKKQVEKDLSELHINENDIADRSNYHTALKIKSFVTSLTEVTHRPKDETKKWSEERKIQFIRKMKDYWAIRKARDTNMKAATKPTTKNTNRGKPDDDIKKQLKHKHRGP